MEYLTKSELRCLFSVAYEHNRRHHLSMVVGLWHALRISELLSLTKENFYNDHLIIQRLKGSKQTNQPIHIDEDPLFDESPILTLVPGIDGRLFGWTKQNQDLFLKKYAKLAGIHASKAHSHCVMKHSMAMMLWDETHSLGLIQSYLGHVAASSTLCYLYEADALKAQKVVSQISL